MLEFIVVIAFFAVGIYILYKITEDVRDYLYRFTPHAKAVQKIRAAVHAHLETLARKRNQLVYYDDYGNVRGDKWNAELQYFLDEVVVPKLTQKELRAIRFEISEIGQEEIENVVKEVSYTLKEASTFDGDMSPLDFERFTADLLAKMGWDARATTASGDQGADVYAEKDGESLVVQCKLYGSPVGNKAVQEVIAAKSYYGADQAWVVTNSSYTKSAKQLASVSNVRVLHYSELETERPQRPRLVAKR